MLRVAALQRLCRDSASTWPFLRSRYRDLTALTLYLVLFRLVQHREHCLVPPGNSQVGGWGGWRRVGKDIHLPGQAICRGLSKSIAYNIPVFSLAPLSLLGFQDSSEFFSLYKSGLPPLSCFLSISASYQYSRKFATYSSQASPSQNKNHTIQTPQTQFKMCLFSSPKRRHHYVEEVVVAPRPVSRHSHHSHHHHGSHGSHGRASYTSVTRTTRPTSTGYYPSPRVSQSSYRRSVPVVVEQRRSTRSYRQLGGDWSRVSESDGMFIALH